ncbi:MAG: restriction endonuclease [Nitrospirae bacterium]|nr:restriction endonuclease [Nitrospirota bacterium]
MSLSVKGEEVEAVVRKLLRNDGYKLKNPNRVHGETGADVIAEKDGYRVEIECIGFQDAPPMRSKQFYEVFFRAISRLKTADECVIALPKRFGDGMEQRAKHYGKAWKRIGKAFPKLKIWLIDAEQGSCDAHPWSYWPKKEHRTM